MPVLREFARRWAPVVGDHAARLEIAIGGEIYMRVAQAEDMFRVLLANLGFPRIRVSVSQIWSYCEYLLDDAIEASRSGSRCTARALERRAEAWRFVLRRLCAASLYAVARIRMPAWSKRLLQETRAVLPTRRPVGELLTYIGEPVTEPRHGTRIVLNVAPRGCMVSFMGELLTPAIEGLEPRGGRGGMQALFSSEGDVDEELLMLVALRSFGPDRYYDNNA